MASENINEAQLKVMQNMEELVIDTYNRMRKACSAKCKIALSNYERSEIMKQEAVCLDRCVYKYMCFHDNIGKRLSRDEETFKSLLFPADSVKGLLENEEKS